MATIHPINIAPKLIPFTHASDVVLLIPDPPLPKLMISARAADVDSPMLSKSP